MINILTFLFSTAFAHQDILEFPCSLNLFQPVGVHKLIEVTSTCAFEDLVHFSWKNAFGSLKVNIHYASEGCAQLRLEQSEGTFDNFFMTTDPKTGSQTEMTVAALVEYGEVTTVHFSSPHAQNIDLFLKFDTVPCKNRTPGLRLLGSPKKCTGANYPYVGKWKGHHQGSTAMGLGVAELISPEWAITAKHVAKGKYNHPNERNVEITFGNHASHTTHVKEVHMAPGVDIALVQLRQPVHNVRTVKLNSQVLHGDEKITFTFVGKMPHLHCAFNRNALGGGNYAWQPPMNGRNPGKAGDSGGAWLVDDILIGVISGSGSHHGHKMGRAGQPAFVKDWIDKVVGPGVVQWADVHEENSAQSKP